MGLSIIRKGYSKREGCSWENLYPGLWIPCDEEDCCVIFVTQDDEKFYINDEIFEKADQTWDECLFIPFDGSITLENS